MWIQGHLRRALMDTTRIIPTCVHPTVTMDQVGSRTESLSALGRGAGVGTISIGDVAMAGGATMEEAGDIPGAEDFAAALGTVTPVEADVPSMAVDAASMEAYMLTADEVSVEGDGATAVLVMPSVEAGAEVAAASEAVDVASVEADMHAAVADTEAEAVMVVGTGRFRSKSELQLRRYR